MSIWFKCPLPDLALWFCLAYPWRSNFLRSDNLVSKALLKLILRHGISKNCVSDNGRKFGPLTKTILDRFEIRHTTTTAYRSRSNGKCERIHRELHNKLKAQLATIRSWSQFWPLAQYYINNSPKGSLDNLTSNEAVYGRQFHVPFKLKDPVEDNIQPFVKSLNEYSRVPFICSFLGDENFQILHIIGKFLVEIGWQYKISSF